MNPSFAKLHIVQKQLSVPKGQTNTFANYKYRSLEDICAALKPLLSETESVFWFEDEISQVGDRVYVKATANFMSLEDGSEPIRVSASAREPVSKKGLDDAQVTGATSSYARKYAANALFAIDDTKDADSMAPPERKEQPKKDDSAAQAAYSQFLDIVLSLESPEEVNKFMKDKAKAIQAQFDGTKYLDMLRADCKKRLADLTAQHMEA